MRDENPELSYLPITLLLVRERYFYEMQNHDLIAKNTTHKFKLKRKKIHG